MTERPAVAYAPGWWVVAAPTGKLLGHALPQLGRDGRRAQVRQLAFERVGGVTHGIDSSASSSRSLPRAYRNRDAAVSAGMPRAAATCGNVSPPQMRITSTSRWAS